jgi:hypothetical protein
MRNWVLRGYTTGTAQASQNGSTTVGKWAGCLEELSAPHVEIGGLADEVLGDQYPDCTAKS